MCEKRRLKNVNKASPLHGVFIVQIQILYLLIKVLIMNSIINTTKFNTMITLIEIDWLQKTISNSTDI